jgi:hypothetical protein
MRRDAFTRRWLITVFGITVLLGALLSYTNGQRSDAAVGVVLGGAMVIGNEWWEWRKRTGAD